MLDIDKNIELLKEFIKNANIEDADMNDYFGGEHIIAIENVLKEFEETQAQVKAKKEIDEMINKIKSELEIKDKMIDKMCLDISNEIGIKEENIKIRYRNEVLKGE